MGSISYDIPLSNSKGLNKIILFEGLEIPIIITPSLLEEPILTAQGFYYLNDLNSIARVRFEDDDIKKLSEYTDLEDTFDYILDNYFFEYSKKYPDTKLTSKIDRYIYWRDTSSDLYHRYDNMNTGCLIIDRLNDSTILDITDLESGEYFYDWCLIKNFSENILDEYINKMKQVIKKKIKLETEENEFLGTGTEILPIINIDGTLLTYHQARSFDSVILRHIDKTKSTYTFSDNTTNIKQEIIKAKNYYNKELLAYYFSALKDHSPLSQFRSLYNVIEFFFEEAPKIMNMPFRYESQMIEAVFKWILTEQELKDKLTQLAPNIHHTITSNQITTSGEEIKGLDINAEDLIKEFSARVYQVRNACIHSKKTRKGNSTPRFVPYMDEDKILKHEIPLLQWLSVKIIEKEVETRD